MRILVIGDGELAAATHAALEGASAPVQTCRNLGAALAVLALAPQAFSLVLAESDGCSKNLLEQRIAATGSRAAVVILHAPAPPEAAFQGMDARPALCGIEHNENGCQRLRCALAEARAKAALPGPTAGIDPRPTILAYSAPCRARR
jgi:hypothetical protein